MGLLGTVALACSDGAEHIGAHAAGSGPEVVASQHQGLSVRQRSEWRRSGKVDDRAVDALDAQARTRVVIWLNAPKIASKSARRNWIRSTRAGLRGSSAPAGLQLVEELDNIPGVLAEVNANAVDALVARTEVGRIDLDEPSHGHLAESLPLTSITQVQSQQGLSGAGTRIAVIDSGIDRDNPAFAGRLVDEACFCGSAFTGSCCPNGGTEQLGPGAAEDDEGHGTAVTGVAASQPTATGFGGAAPAAEIISVKVLNDENLTQSSFDPLQALDWIIENHPEVDVVNLSLGTFSSFAGDCDGVSSLSMMYADAVAQLRAGGTLVFASAGNEGSANGMGAPACVRDVISLGSSTDETGSGDCGTAPGPEDRISCFSNLSTTTDLLAPGDVVSTVSLGGSPAAGFTGTSFASPMAAGCALLLREFAPSATPAEIEAALEASPTRLTDTRTQRSYPRLDCADALARLGGGSGECTANSQCDDGDLCTTDVCDASGSCVSEPGACVDESFGTTFGTAVGFEPFTISPLGTSGVDVEWQVIVGPTPTSGTGPAGDHTNAPGEFPAYLYIEASSAGQANATVDGSPNKTAIIESPCVDLAGQTAASFSFYYHMVGESQGQLFLEADRGCDGSYEQLFVHSGPTNGSELNGYVRRDQDLSAYLSDRVRVRLRGVTGSGFSSDIAIDDLMFEIGEASGCTTPAQCPGDDLFCTTATCSSQGVCGSEATDCAGLLCSEALDACVECLSSADCPGGTCDGNGQCVSAPACTQFVATTQQHIDAGRATTQVLFNPSRVEARVVGSGELLDSRAFFTNFGNTPRTLRTRLSGQSGFELGACP